MSNTVISVENLGKKYFLLHRSRYLALRDVLAEKLRNIWLLATGRFHKKEKDEFWALSNVSFQVEKGDVVGIIGRNGAGKSTLLKVLSRITEPTTGKVEINGRVGSLLEVGTGFHPELTGRENIFLNGAILGMPKQEIVKKFDRIVEFAEIERFLDTQVKHYSSGMYMRLAFSVAAHLDPDILLVDEVLAVGDAKFQKKCIGKMEEVSKQGRTVFFVSHNMGSISALCNKCLMLSGGKLAEYGDTHDVIAKYNEFEKMATTVNVTSDMRNGGNGAIEFQSVSLSNQEGEAKNSFLIGEQFRLSIELTSAMNGEISFWLIVFDESGKPLLSTHQRDSELVKVKKGKYILDYLTRDLGLMPGNYTISAGAFDAHMEFLEWIECCQKFEVLPCFKDGRAFDTRWGQINQPAEWVLNKG